MLAYFLKANVAIALFYAFYRLFFYKDTFFGWRRMALLCFFAISAAVPLLNIQTWVTEQEPMVAMADLYATVVLPEFTIETGTTSATDWKSIIWEGADIAYWGVVALLAMRFIVQLAGIIRMGCRCRKVQIGRTEIHLLPHADGPFSFFHWIFIHPSSHTEEELDEILTHEQTHARQWHSLDVIISELVCIFCWCNPFAWLMKREIRTNLEYMADARVLEDGYDSKTYQYHLLGLSHQKAAATIYNSFNVLPLKKRIKMMNKKRTKEIGRTKYLMFLPLAALLMIVSNIESVARTTKKIATEVMEAVDSKTEQPATEVQASQAVPQPEQDTENVTFKGKVVDKAGKPVQGVNILSDPYSIPAKVVTQADGSFEFKASPKVSLLFLYKDGDKEWSTSFMNSELPQENRTNWTVVYNNEKWLEVIHSDPGTPDNPIFEIAEQMPEFPGGGMPALMNYLGKNTRYPETAMKNGTQGRVTVQFVVEADGSITNTKVLNLIDPELEKEAIRVISAMPKWKPGMQKGKAVRVRYTVPVMFRLTKDKTPVKYTPMKVDYKEGTTQPATGNGNAGKDLFEVVEKMPKFPGGGMPALMEYLEKNIKYPETARKNGTQGRVTVQFVVETDGSITNVRPLRNVEPELDKEAVRVISTMPKWEPGMQDGKAVRVKFTVPVKFRLPEPEKTPAAQNTSANPN